MSNLPADINRILELIAGWAQGYDNHLKWDEIAKLKSDMMKHMDRWGLVSTQQIRNRCAELGMRDEDIAEIADMHARRLQGRRLVPNDSYRDFEFNHRLAEDE